MLNASQKSWEAYRRRMLEETARFIEWGLRHPDEVIEIPSKPAEDGGFPPKVGEWFWGVVLTDRADSRIQRWRQMLRRGSRSWLRRVTAPLGDRGSAS